MYYGWNNSITICGWVGYVPRVKTNSKGKRMIYFDLYIPRYNIMPVREGEARERLDAVKIKVIGGENIIRVMGKRHVNKGDILVVTGVLLSFPTEKNGFVYDFYYVEPHNVTALKGFKGMKAIEYNERNEMIYNDLLRELKVVHDDPSDSSGLDK